MFFLHNISSEYKVTLKALYEQYGGMLKLMVYRLTCDTHISEDAVQQTFERLMKYPDTISKCEVQNRKFLLIAICKNELRRLINREMHEIDKSEKYCENITITQAEYNDALTEYLKNESIESIKEKVMKLDDMYALPFFLREYHGLSLRRIAKIMGLSISGVRKRIEKARELIVISMKKEDEADEKNFAKIQ